MSEISDDASLLERINDVFSETPPNSPFQDPYDVRSIAYVQDENLLVDGCKAKPASARGTRYVPRECKGLGPVLPEGETRPRNPRGVRM